MKTFCGIEVEDFVVEYLSWDYKDFMTRKNIYLQDRTDDNYLELTFVYAGLDARLKDLLSRGVLDNDKFYRIRDKLKEGL